MQFPKKIQEALKKTTEENRRCFYDSVKSLQTMGLPVYTTNSPDLRVRHPRNDIVFCTLWFQPRAGARFEIRVDGCPKSVQETGDVKPTKLRQYDAGSRARWALFPIKSDRDVSAAITVVRNVMSCDPAWGK